ncbi:septation protein SepH [Dermabacter sp. p3-SID358]|uniref:septation protein SepH n=1 Tax=Dermabacter sp. p3-SID358 TaxID=2916114 RepID=UPI0021A61D68|nr:septation protein SepH [Dermabacter sp. p3-SID358]MCT1866168.1 septation protein SepH [Dermabacter sp. p3-SID358]
MRELTLGGLHENSDHLILLDSEGERYTVRIDEALRAAVRRDASSVGLIQQSQPSALRPKDIQAMLRGGSTVESIAELAGMEVEHVRRYEGPVRAERDHTARRAQEFRTSKGGTEKLIDIVEPRLRARGVEEDLEWDAWRRSDGTWTLQLTFVAGGRSRVATWQADLPDRVVTADDNEARWLSDSEATREDSSTRTRFKTQRAHVFNIEEGEASSSNESPSVGAPISERELDLLNARRGTPAPGPVSDSSQGRSSTDRDDTTYSSPWQSLEDYEPEPAFESSGEHTIDSAHDSEAEERPAPVRIVPLNARHHDDREDSADSHDTEEVSYIEGPEDLAEAPDPAHDPAASEDNAHENISSEKEAPADDTAEDASPSNEADSTTSNNDVDDEKLTPLPGFDDEPKKPTKKPKRQRASIPSWDDIVFGHKD